MLMRGCNQHEFTLVSLVGPWHMDDTGLQKKNPFGKLGIGKWSQHKPKLVWRDCASTDLRSFQITSDWHSPAFSRKTWHTMLQDGSVTLDIALDDKAQFSRACCKGMPF